MNDVFTTFADASKLLEEYKFFGDTVSINRKDRVKAVYTLGVLHGLKLYIRYLP
jgi:hypothetical protein